jgi:hydroxypyruvate reductase
MSMNRFNDSILANDPIRRTTMLEILEGALTEVDPDRAVRRALRSGDDGWEIAGVQVDPTTVDRVRLLAFGKAAPAMAQAAVDVFGEVEIRGLVASNHAEPFPDTFDVYVTGHPLPDEHSATAARAALDLLGDAGERDLIVCLVSGGGSALLELPAAGISLEDEQATVDALLSCGADINELNTLRKHLSAIKGGRLAQAADPARLFTLILSDVVGNPLDVIASGPTVPDPTTFNDSLAVLDRYDLRERIPRAVVDHLEAGRNGTIEETPKTPYERQVVSIIGDGPAAARGAAEAARQAGLSVAIATTTMTGHARTEALACLAAAGPGVTVFAGETTVQVAGRGRGGRNQEAALAAARELAGDPATVFAALGTDGIDGPTDAAGAIVDGWTTHRGAQLGLDADRHLADNDSGTYLEATGDLLIAGPTGTNVGDVWIVMRDRAPD